MCDLLYLQNFGGSAKVAKELFDMLQPKNADFVTEEEMRERLDDVLTLYLKKKDEDKSGLLVISWIWSSQSFLLGKENYKCKEDPRSY